MAGGLIGPAPRMNDAMQARNGARWFYWIAGITVVNSALALGRTTFMLIFGMFTPLLATYVGIQMGLVETYVGFGIAVCVALAFAGFGWMAERGATWAFITGLVLYVADGVVAFVFEDWLTGLAHVFASVVIGMGMLAVIRMKRAGAFADGAVVAPAGFSAGVRGAMPVPASLAPPAPDVVGFAEAKAPAPLD